MATISACIVTYGGYKEAVAAANSVVQHTKTCPLTLYMVDNASPDGTGKKLMDTPFPENVHVQCLPQNLGFGKGHNSVIPQLNSDYHFVLNPDILVEYDVLSEMSAWMDEHPDVVMATPKLFFPDGRLQVLPKRRPNVLGLLSRQGFPGLQKYGDRYAMLDEDLSGPTDIQFCTGSFFCIRTSVFRQMGGFDPGYFMYVEDADITQKALQHGRVCYLPQFRAIHAWHRSPNKHLDQAWMQFKSMGRYFHKWGFAFK